MESRGLNFSQLAKETGLAPGTVRSYAKNQFNRIDVNSAVVLCDFFDVPIEGLFQVVKE
ncbi:MAG: helix-turn-helix domain-containing protein [Brasilonema sp.]